MKKAKISKLNPLLIGVLLSTAIAAGGCSKDAGSFDSNITGILPNSSWIESSKRLDTIVFPADVDRIFNLNRKRTPDNLPGAFSGPYFYALKPDSIAVIWSASSLYTEDVFIPFRIDGSGTRLSIGNFYDSTLPTSTILQFDRLR